jgi:acyl-CoA reductase-like NAD-dependent aldehyde dehydrogenase
MTASQRGALMRRLGDIVKRDAEVLARIESTDNGKLYREMLGQWQYLPEYYYYFSGMADKLQGDTVPSDRPNFFIYTRREPLGVVGAITPWNSPMLLLTFKLAPGLAAGCTFVVKPSEHTSVSTLEFAKRVKEAGFPDGVFNVVTGQGSLGAALVKHPGIDKIAFTGDTSTGKGIMRGAAGTLKKITLELGGKSPNIVFADADIEAAIRGATIGIFYGKGEVCAAGSRLLVDRSIKAEFIDKLAARARKMVPGDPLDPKTRFGALSSKKQMDTVLRYIESGKTEGASLVAGGARADIGTGKGYFVQPTVFADVQPGMTISREEIFGPVLAAIDFADIDEAIARANDTPYGLAAGVWTRDIKKAHYVARKLQAGTVWINTYNVYDTAAPFGGYKQSGFGREMSAHALEHYTQVKSVWVDLNM